MVLRKDGDKKTVAGAGKKAPLPGWDRKRLGRELANDRPRTRQSAQLREIAANHELGNEPVPRDPAQFHAPGMVTPSGSVSAIVRSPSSEETQEAYKIRAEIEELAGRTAATVLKGYTAGLQNELAVMRAAVAYGDLDACAEHDVKFHRDILKASQNDVLLRVWDTLADDLRIRSVVGNASEDLPQVVESHQLIVDALEKGCGEEAGLLLRNHVETSLEYLGRAESDLKLVVGHVLRRPVMRVYRGGLSPARLRRVTELVHAKIEDDLSLDDMAESAGLSTAHFSQMFRKSTGESPHQFVLRQRVERAKEMLRAGEGRILDVAIACGFKTQQHFARVFRRICGASPTEYREEILAPRSDYAFAPSLMNSIEFGPKSQVQAQLHVRHAVY